MASLLSLFIFLFSISSISTSTGLNVATTAVPVIKRACKATRFPDVCEKSLSRTKASTPIDVIEAAITVSRNNLQTAKKMVASIKDSSAGNLNRTTAADICIQVLDNANFRTDSTSDAMKRGSINDARAWLSAALGYQYDCLNNLQKVNDTKLVIDTISYLDSLIVLTSNGLSMIWSFDNFGPDFNKWTVPKTERDGFWKKTGPGAEAKLTSAGGVPRNLKISATVCKAGCDYNTVQAAVNAAPAAVSAAPAAENKNANEKFVIHIKAGTYVEKVRVPLDKRNVVFLGDGMGKTIISGSAYNGQPGITTTESATIGTTMVTVI